MTTRLKPADRKKQILDVAVRLAERIGYQRVTRHAIAEAAETSDAIVSHYHGTMTSLRRDIMRTAVRTKCLTIIAQGLAVNDPHALKASDELKKSALASLLKV